MLAKDACGRLKKKTTTKDLYNAFLTPNSQHTHRKTSGLKIK